MCRSLGRPPHEGADLLLCPVPLLHMDIRVGLPYIHQSASNGVGEFFLSRSQSPSRQSLHKGSARPSRSSARFTRQDEHAHSSQQVPSTVLLQTTLSRTHTPGACPARSSQIASPWQMETTTLATKAAVSPKSGCGLYAPHTWRNSVGNRHRVCMAPCIQKTDEATSTRP